MLISFQPGVQRQGPEVAGLLTYLKQYTGVTALIHPAGLGSRDRVEVYLTGEVAQVPRQCLVVHPGVQRVVNLAERYRLVGRHGGDLETFGFVYNGVPFDDQTFHVFAGLCAVDTPKNVAVMMSCLRAHGLVTTRMGAYKPRTSPYDFQGHGRECLSYVFELAGEYGIRVIAMEVLCEAQIDEIHTALERAGRPTGVMLQIGTRNAQNFELLKHVGQQLEFPVLYKRGMGLTLEESLNACEYIASAGNRNIVFCLRGVKTHLGDPHRNLVDFAHVPVVKRLTRLPLCVDPSHAVGRRDRAYDGIHDIEHAAAQGIIAGADMLLVDVHPEPKAALCDGPQALLPDELSPFLQDVAIVRQAYEQRRALARARADAPPTVP